MYYTDHHSKFIPHQLIYSFLLACSMETTRVGGTGAAIILVSLGFVGNSWRWTTLEVNIVRGFVGQQFPNDSASWVKLELLTILPVENLITYGSSY